MWHVTATQPLPAHDVRKCSTLHRILKMINLLAIIGAAAILWALFIAYDCFCMLRRDGMFSKEWWETPPNQNDMFFVHIRESYQTLRTFFGRMFIDRYYDKDGGPKRCIYCGSTTIYEETKEIVQNHVAEFRCECCSCQETIGYWAYGGYDPMYREMAFKVSRQ